MKGKLDSLIITSHMPRTSSLVAIFIAAGVCLRIGVAELAPCNRDFWSKYVITQGLLCA